MIKLTAEVIDGFVQTLLAPAFDDPTTTPHFHKELWDLCCSDHNLIAIAAPRGHAKSTAISLGYVMAMALFRQAKFIILVSDTEPQAIMFLGSIKQHLESNNHLRKLFGVVNLVKNNETDIICELSDGYQFRIMAKGTGQRVRGINWENRRPDLIVCDDLENDEIVLNAESRDKFKRWFFGALLPCRSPKGKVRVVGTIIHMDGVLNKLMPNPWSKYTKIEGLRTFDVNPKAAWKSYLYKAHNDDFSEILWKDRWPKESLQAEYNRLSQLGYPELYAQEYLNNPIDESTAFFKKSDFGYITEAEKKDIAEKKLPLLFYAGVDLAISEKERADYSVFVIAGTDSNNHIYVVDVIRARLDGREIVDTIMQIQQRYNLQFIAIEDEKISRSLSPFIKEEVIKQGVFPSLLPMRPHADKKVRARSIQARMRIGSVKFDKSSEWYPILESEFLKFNRDVHDDQVDAFAYLGLALDKMSTANTLKEQIEEEDQIEMKIFGADLLNSGRSAMTGY
jgi:predicted phage terminase large subunit-like protein